MSFSSDLKNELVSRKYTSESSAVSELAGIVCFGGKLRKNNGEYVLSFLTENPRVARRIYSLLKGTLTVNSRIQIRKNSSSTFYDVVIDIQEDITTVFRRLYLIGKECSLDTFVNYHIDAKLVSSRDGARSFIRGAFLAGGSCMNPHKTYHLEFTTSRYGVAKDFMELLTDAGIPAKQVTRKSKFVMYYKNSESIADVLTVIGCVNSLMEYHNARIVKEISNNVNRTVNCEEANMDKTINASMEHAKCIQKLIDSGKFESLPDNLREIALLRMEYRELSLVELGQMLKKPLGKSGVNHRLRKIMDIANSF